MTKQTLKPFYVILRNPETSLDSAHVGMNDATLNTLSTIWLANCANTFKKGLRNIGLHQEAHRLRPVDPSQSPWGARLYCLTTTPENAEHIRKELSDLVDVIFPRTTDFVQAMKASLPSP